MNKMAADDAESIFPDQLRRMEECPEAEESSAETGDVLSFSRARMSWEADRSWCLRVIRLVNQFRLAYTQLAWCSTLGGAHSALGEESRSHAEKAGLVSRQQLALAVAMGNPVMVATCKVYLALSLMQLGHTLQAGRIIRLQYEYAKGGQEHGDGKLQMLCLSAWEKLRYLKQKGRRRRRRDKEQDGLGSTS